MGNQGSYRQAGNQPQQDPRTYFQIDLPKFVVNSKIGNGKFMKTYSVKVDGVLLVVKVYMKAPDEDLTLHSARFSKLWRTISPARYPNLLPYQMWIKSSTRMTKTNAIPIYVIRQYLYSNLHDRLSTRPFLNELEKLWLIYQLFKCVEVCHSHSIIHGDIKAENILCTTWNFLVLTDFAPHKPTMLPDDDPTDFQYYFDTMGRSSCYIAPERFYHREVRSGGIVRQASGLGGEYFSGSGEFTSVGESSNTMKVPLTTSMDVFSLGCTIAEIFLDGETFLDLPGMLKYLQSAPNPHRQSSANQTPTDRLDSEESPAKGMVNRITHKLLREVVVDMTQKCPENRASVQSYRHILEGRRSPGKMATLISSGLYPDDAVIPENECPFPAYFSKCIHPLFQRLHLLGVTPDDRISIICEFYSDIMNSVTNVEDKSLSNFFKVTMRGAVGAPRGTKSSVKEAEDAEREAAMRVYWKQRAVEARSRPMKSDGSAPFQPLHTNVPLPSEPIKMKIPKTESQEKDSKSRMGSDDATIADDNKESSPFMDTPSPRPPSEEDSKSIVDFRRMSLEVLILECKKLIDLTEAQVLGEPDPSVTDNVFVEVKKAKQSAIIPEVASAEALMQAALSLNNGVETSANISPEVRLRNNNILDGDITNTLGHSVKNRPFFEGLVLPVQLICTCFRHLKCPQSKIVSLMLLVRFGVHCSDDVILNRIIPLFVLAVGDVTPYVRATAVRCLRSVSCAVRQVNSIQANIFPSYIIPALGRHVARDTEAVVRIAFAESLGRLAEVAKRFLDQAALAAQIKALSNVANVDSNGMPGDIESIRRGTVIIPAADRISGQQSQEGTGPSSHSVEFTYDSRLKFLHDTINRWIRDIVLDSSYNFNLKAESLESVNDSSPVSTNVLQDTRKSVAFHAGAVSSGTLIKRVLLVDVMRLCIFFGQDASMDMLLRYLLTYLNDQDWELRHAFCSKIASVCVFMGPTVTTEYILPCIENALADVEERVVTRALQCLTSLIQLGLLSKMLIVNTVSSTASLALHPCYSVRSASLELFAAACKYLGNTDSTVFIAPLLLPVMRYDLIGAQIDRSLLVKAACKPISRSSYRLALHGRLKSSEDVVPYESTVKISVPEGRLNEAGSSLSRGSGDPNDLIFVDSDAKVVSESREIGKALSLNSKALGNGIEEALALVDVDEAAKLRIMNDYLDRAAVEIKSKSVQNRNSVGQFLSAETRLRNQRRSFVGRVGPNPGGNNHSTLDSLLSFSSHSILDHSCDSLLVPNQKFGAHFFPPVATEQMRCVIHADPLILKSSSKVRAFYGIAFTQGDAARALSAGVLDQWENQLASLGIVSEPSKAQNAAAAKNAQAGFSKSPFGSQRLAGGLDGANGGGANNYTNSKLYAASSTYDTRALVKRVRALQIPPLPPDVGLLSQPTDDRKYNFYSESLDTAPFGDPMSRSNWRPRENVLVATLREHTRAVSNLAIAQDQSFFVSGSEDRSVKIWRVKGLDKISFPRSCHTYDGHRGAITGVAVLENSHTVASCSDDGSIHVWRVDVATSAPGSGAEEGNASNNSNDDSMRAEVSQKVNVGVSEIKQIKSEEGSVVAIQHYNGDIASVITYLTQHGGLHGWDMRSTTEAFNFNLRPELGSPTCLTLAPDRNWICVGTTRGFVSLWDIRYNIMSKLWRHSSNGPIYRLASCKSLPRQSPLQQLQQNFNMPATEGAYLFAAAGLNEAAVFGLPEAGECLKCFRSIPMSMSREPLAPLPQLIEVDLPRHPAAPILSALQDKNFGVNSYSNINRYEDLSVRAIMGRISLTGTSYLVTAGTDKIIRYWDFSAPAKCFAVCGLQPAQPKPTFETPTPTSTTIEKSADGTSTVGFYGKLFLSYDSAVPSQDTILQAHLPLREGRGPIPPSNGCKDSILDLKSIDIPMRMMISASRDGEIKLWR